MKEQLISLETAKLAKEKGFNIFNIDINLKNNIIINDNDIYIDSKNIDGKYYLYINEDNCVYSLEVGQFNSVIGSFNSFAKEYMLKETNDYFHAPTQSLLQKFIREQRGIHIEVHRNASGYYWSMCKANGGTDLGCSEYSGPNAGGVWDSFEDALENAMAVQLSYDLPDNLLTIRHWGNYVELAIKEYKKLNFKK